MKSFKRLFSAAPEGTAALFFIQIFSTLGFAVLYSTLIMKTKAKLRQAGADFAFDDRHIGGIERAVGVDVGAEVGRINRLADARLRLRDIGRVNDSVRAGVADQDPHRDVEVSRRSVCGAIDPVDSDVDHLRVGNVRERYSHNSATDRDVTRADAIAANATGAAGHLRLWRAGHRDVAREGDNQRVIVGATRGAAFHSRAAGERHGDIKVARRAMGLARHGAVHCNRAREHERVRVEVKRVQRAIGIRAIAVRVVRPHRVELARMRVQTNVVTIVHAVARIRRVREPAAQARVRRPG